MRNGRLYWTSRGLGWLLWKGHKIHSCRAGELGGIFAQQSQDLVRLDESTKAIGERTRKSNQRREELAERQKALVER